MPGGTQPPQPKAVWVGRTGQRAFGFLSREGREGRENGEVAEQRYDNSPAINGLSLPTCFSFELESF